MEYALPQSGPTQPLGSSRRHSTGAVSVRRQQRRPDTTTRRSIDIGSIAIPHPLLADVSSNGDGIARHPSVPAAALRRYDWTRQSGVRDSGLATSSPITQFNSFIRDSSPQRPLFEPLSEDRPSLFRVGLPSPPPTITRERPAHIQRAPARIQRRGIYAKVRRMLAFFGYGTGNHHRKELVTLVWTLSFGFVQFAVTISLISYSSVHHSPAQPTISEWTACDKPLGLWGCFWLVKIVMDCCMTYWGWRRDWKIRQSDEVESEVDLEDALSGPGDRLPRDEHIDPSIFESVNNDRRRRRPDRPMSKLYSRLSLLLSLIIISWFLTSNILVFTSLHSCRFAAPHLWWLIFSILCLQYLLILEVFAIAVLVFIIGPLIYLFWNIFLVCLGRHPMQNPHYISPEVGKISKTLVDQIPLVLYIPSPPGEEKNGVTDSGPDAKVITKPKPAYGSAEHTYPPKSQKRHFMFLRRSTSKLGSPDSDDDAHDEKGARTVTIWEDCWEQGEFPFVRLTENRASCAICLLDFEEPRRRVAREVIKSWAQNNTNKEDVAPGKAAPEDANITSDNSSTAPATRQSGVQEVDRNISDRDSMHSLRLEDAGEGPQPLRLLECGHVFHKTCVDPWLTDVSGRCPTCQRRVLFNTSQKGRDRDRP